VYSTTSTGSCARRAADRVEKVEDYGEAIFPWCFTPELNAERPDYLDSLATFVRSRPAQSVPDFIRQSNAVLAHNVEAHLSRITAPTQITYGRRDQLTSTPCGETPQSLFTTKFTKCTKHFGS
jgi:pimeloyl-ACP methyl ester carboxylesterase